MQKTQYVEGQLIGECLLIKEIPSKEKNKHMRYVQVKCSCGKVFEARLVSVQSGISCGCKQVAWAKKAFTIHGACKRNKHTKLYSVWSSLKDRCLNPNSKYYSYYGGRGITVYDEWINSFDKFQQFIIGKFGVIDEAKHLTIDRIDNDKGYYPDNIRLATMQEQAFNKRDRKDIITVNVNGNILTLNEFARSIGLTRRSVYSKIHRYKKSVDDIIKYSQKRKAIREANTRYYRNHNT